MKNGDVSLTQNPIEATKYDKLFADKDIFVSESERVFTDQSDIGASGSILTKNEKLAIRRWTAIDDEIDIKSFSDGMRQLKTIGVSDKNYELNMKLDHPGTLNEDERNMVRILDSALNKLPSQHGDFVRISEYSESITPWDVNIRPKDIVTNYPRYMSVSSTTDYLEQGGVSPLPTKTYVYYKFEDTESSKPLLKGAASLNEDLENLYQRDMTFEVKHIAISDAVTPEFDTPFVPRRIVVVLKEAPLPADRIAKNIHTGEEVMILM
ncbi:hypothetical protein [Izhakiella capsodis]|nr:hypothetical protein [Izhakiella capsodis]